jgi:hypothetical protein
MKGFRILSGLVLGAALIVPIGAWAAGDDHDSDRYHGTRYYDRDVHDYHVWSDHEDRAYRLYLGEQHRDYREFHRVKASRQREYWRWRHSHPDSAIFRVEIR